jgi:hypothetical protein
MLAAVEPAGDRPAAGERREQGEEEDGEAVHGLRRGTQRVPPAAARERGRVSRW